MQVNSPNKGSKPIKTSKPAAKQRSGKVVRAEPKARPRLPEFTDSEDEAFQNFEDGRQNKMFQKHKWKETGSCENPSPEGVRKSLRKRKQANFKESDTNSDSSDSDSNLSDVLKEEEELKPVTKKLRKFKRQSPVKRKESPRQKQANKKYAID